MSVAFGGFHNETATFKVTEEISKGTPVKISDNATVAACGEGDEFCGIIAGGDNAYAAVQIYGEVTAKFSGTAPELGYTALVAGADGVKAGGSREYLVVAIDEAAGTVTFLM
ncbi:MAG: hypothetical protein J6J45_09730 [Clostridia bacterium]|nr:hypothetical protein [Clostridia bacterium]